MSKPNSESAGEATGVTLWFKKVLNLLYPAYSDESARASGFIRLGLVLVPALGVVIFTAFVDFQPLGSGGKAFLGWAPIEIGFSAVIAATGLASLSYFEMRAARIRLAEANRAEAVRRTIAAIGIAASWDLDLGRLYQRISQDLRSIIGFDRLTITAALPTGRMRVEFVLSDTEEGIEAGTVLPENPEEPDGLWPEHASQYGSRLTAAIPACNGTLTVRRRGEGKYDARDLDLLRQAVAQISPGIANAILFQASERRVNERTALAEIGRAATSARSPKAIVQSVDRSLSKLINYDHMGVIFTDDADGDSPYGQVDYWSKNGLAGWHTGDRVTFDRNAAKNREVLAGTAIGPIGFEVKADLTGNNQRAWLQAPLVAQEEFIGFLALSSENIESFGAEESALLLNVSLQIAPAIQNAKLAASLKRQVDERRAIAAIGLAANRELKLQAIYTHVADELDKVLPFDRFSITSISQSDRQRKIEFVRGIEVEGFSQGDTVPAPSSTREGEIVDGRDWSLLSEHIQTLGNLGELKSRLTAQLGTDPHFFGTLNIASKQEGVYDSQAAEFIERVAIQVTPAIQNALMLAAERELRKTLDRQHQELFEANNARKQFLSTVSHELKTPLTIIAGFVDLLASPEAANDQEEMQETLSIIRRNANQLDVLINDILDISRLDAGTFKINPAPFKINELISDLEASFQSLLRAKTQTMRVDMPDDEIWIEADRSRIGQVVTNLLSNASKYSPEETEITLGCAIDDDRLHFTVSDHGVGMSEEDQKRLFTAFFRVDNETTRQVAGTGLGLVIAKSITELHGGEIRLESKPGEGTKIEFWLPGITTRAAVEEEASRQVIAGSRLWPDGLPGELELGAD